MIDKCVRPPLHMKLGMGQTVDKIGENFMNFKNLQKLVITSPRITQSHAFEGNQIVEILKNLDKIEKIVSEDLVPFVHTF